jgi:hypothetical protein
MSYLRVDSEHFEDRFSYSIIPTVSHPAHTALYSERGRACHETTLMHIYILRQIEPFGLAVAWNHYSFGWLAQGLWIQAYCQCDH